MRADRLVAILLLLQRRDQVTAAEVADELEISERTARRDLEALGMAGIPVYPVRGRGGGWRLAGGGTTDLTGLTAGEARALFLIAGPHADVTGEVRSALRKLVRALPEPLRDRAEAASNAIVVDPTGWDRAEPADVPTHLDAAQQAVIDRRQVRLGYRARSGAETVRLVHPLGVAAKGATWYLLAGTDRGNRTFRIDRITGFEATDLPVERPDDFDLAASWREVVDRVDLLRTTVIARVSIRADMVRHLQAVAGRRLSIGVGEVDGWLDGEVRGANARSLAADLAGFGAFLQIHEPAELRDLLASIGAELVASYGAAAAPDSGFGLEGPSR